MKILYISSHFNPFEYNTGSSQRYNLLLRACAAFADVDVITFMNNVVSDIPNCNVIYAKESKLPEVGGRLYRFKRLLRAWDLYSFFPKDKNRSSIVASIIKENKYDYIVTRYIPRALECGLLKYIDKLIIDVDDHPVDVMLTLSKNATSKRAKKYYKILSFLMRNSINNMLSKVRFSFFPNQSQVYKLNSAYLPNIPYYENSILPYTSNDNILFVGDLKYEPNIKGVEHFITKIFPKIRLKVPNAHFIVVGKYKNEEWKATLELNKGVSVVGFVEDLKPYYQNARLCVVPIYSGAGTNIKVLEALQMGRACVVSKEGTRGFAMNLQSGVDYSLASNDEEFVENVVSLMIDVNLCNQIAIQGAQTVRKYYSREYFNSIVRNALYHE